MRFTRTIYSLKECIMQTSIRFVEARLIWRIAWDSIEMGENESIKKYFAIVM